MIGTSVADVSSTFYRFPRPLAPKFSRRFRSPPPVRLLPGELTDLLGLDRHEELPLLHRRLRRRIPFGFAVRQVGHDFHQPLPEPGVRDRNVLSLIDADHSLASEYKVDPAKVNAPANGCRRRTSTRAPRANRPGRSPSLVSISGNVAPTMFRSVVKYPVTYSMAGRYYTGLLAVAFRLKSPQMISRYAFRPKRPQMFG